MAELPKTNPHIAILALTSLYRPISSSTLVCRNASINLQTLEEKKSHWLAQSSPRISTQLLVPLFFFFLFSLLGVWCHTPKNPSRCPLLPFYISLQIDYPGTNLSEMEEDDEASAWLAILFWIRILSLPIGCFSLKVVESLVSSARQVKEVRIETHGPRTYIKLQWPPHLSQLLDLYRIRYKRKMVADPLCSLNKDRVESTEHLLLLCPWTQEIWAQPSLNIQKTYLLCRL